MDNEEPDLRTLLNAQAGKADWEELQRHFARGVLVLVANDLDLIEVAARVTEDDKVQIEAWMTAGKVRGPEVEDAKRWSADNSEFWTVVVAPWVLVQEVAAAGDEKDPRH